MRRINRVHEKGLPIFDVEDVVTLLAHKREEAFEGENFLIEPRRTIFGIKIRRDINFLIQPRRTIFGMKNRRDWTEKTSRRA